MLTRTMLLQRWWTEAAENGVAPGFEGPVVVIGRDSLEGKIGNAVAAQNGGEASHGVGGSVFDGVVLGSG